MRCEEGYTNLFLLNEEKQDRLIVTKNNRGLVMFYRSELLCLLIFILRIDFLGGDPDKKSAKSSAVVEGSCKDTVKYCKQYIPYCLTHKSRLRGRCDKTCRYCGPKLCDDRRSDCMNILSYCSSLRGMCDKSCGYCGNSSALVLARLKCRDTRPDCKQLLGYCVSHKKRMTQVCKKSCGYCKRTPQRLNKRAKIAPATRKILASSKLAGSRGTTSVITKEMKGKNTCRDTGSNCKRVQKYCHTQEPMKQVCAKTCGFCGRATSVIAKEIKENKTCRDVGSNCKRVQKYCHTREPMKRVCSKTCGFCGGAVAVASKRASTEEVCRDEKDNCKFLAKYCDRYKSSMKRTCRKTCKYCGGKKAAAVIDTCRDQRKDCKKLTKYCTTNKNSMKRACKKTCGYCGNCTDKFSTKNCQLLKKYGKCKGELRYHCAHTCGSCGPPQPKECAQSRYGCCWDKKTIKKTASGLNCPPCVDKFESLCDALKKSCKKISYARRVCLKTCGICSSNS